MEYAGGERFCVCLPQAAVLEVMVQGAARHEFIGKMKRGVGGHWDRTTTR